jgi:hypothetical protein
VKSQPQEAAQLHQNVYIEPERLVPSDANLKARPGETAASRKERIETMARSIAVNGQEYPVLVVEVHEGEETRYEYVDGGARVDAITHIKTNHDKYPSTDANIKVWCSLVDAGTDLYRKALISNMHRTQNSIMEMAMIVQDVRERYGWKSRGGAGQVAEFLGIQNSRVTEYEKILRAPKAVRERIESGEIGSVDAALKLIDVPEPDQAVVTVRAAQLAKKEREVKNTKLAKKGVAPVDTTKPAPIQSKHIVQATKETKGERITMTRAEILAWITGLTGPAYGAAVHNWAEYMLDSLIPGGGTTRRAYSLFDIMLSTKGGAMKPQSKTTAKTTAKTVTPSTHAAKSLAKAKADKKPVAAKAVAKKTRKPVTVKGKPMVKTAKAAA